MANVNVQKIILQIIKEVATPFASPNYPETWLLRETLKIIEKELGEEPVRWKKYSVSQAISKLVKDKIVRLDGEGLPRLTEKGKQRLLHFELNDFAIQKPKVWDYKYRIIIFDISEHKGGIRRSVRRQLVIWGFVRLQNSVWVHPYECEEVIALLKTHFGVVNEVLYITADSIENDTWLKKEFGLV